MSYSKLKNDVFTAFYQLKEEGYPIKLIKRIILAECLSKGQKVLTEQLFIDWLEEVKEIDKIDLKNKI